MLYWLAPGEGQASCHPERNPQLFKGKYITITRWADGSLHPNFRPMPRVGASLSVSNYAFEVYRELQKGLIGLIESED